MLIALIKTVTAREVARLSYRFSRGLFLTFRVFPPLAKYVSRVVDFFFSLLNTKRETAKDAVAILPISSIELHEERLKAKNRQREIRAGRPLFAPWLRRRRKMSPNESRS